MNVISLADFMPQKSGCKASNCGEEKIPPALWDKIKDHPCYSEEAHHHFARMHVAVAPGCNMQCNYCNRKFDCANESRPGVTSEKLTPEQALQKVKAVAAQMPQLSVVGIAGPGDTLFSWRQSFATFALIREALPDLKLCLSTNGLALPDHIDKIIAHKIDHVTITINMIDPSIGAQIYPWIYHEGKRYQGLEASEILHHRQMEGLKALVNKGVLVKVNSVMIPGINDQHLLQVNAEIKKNGAFIHNILPLISDPAHGTFFGQEKIPEPSPMALEALQASLNGRVMRHCRQCRADAIGLLGEDKSQDFTLDKLAAEAPDSTRQRKLYRQLMETEKASPLVIPSGPLQRVAICSQGGGRINQHFGHAKEFKIYEIGDQGVKFIGHRKIPNYCQGGFGEDEHLPTILEALAGIDTVFAAKIGSCPKRELAQAGVAVNTDYALEEIPTALSDWYQNQQQKEKKHGTCD